MQSRMHQVVVANVAFLPRIIGLVLDVKSRLQHEVDNSFPGPQDQRSELVRPSMGCSWIVALPSLSGLDQCPPGSSMDELADLAPNFDNVYLSKKQYTSSL
jgi:hypothetical protein